MLFNSISFLIFFPIVTALYFILPHRFRTVLLLVASCIFYMAFIPKYIVILLVTILIDYFAGIFISREAGKKKRLYLLISILSTCLVLFIFKYFNFFNSNMASLARLLHWNYPIQALSIILPIGLSFHTFQSLSYVIEVYRGHQEPERNFLTYALYVMFYPQLVAGPIERPQNLLHQFYEKHYFDYARVVEGLKWMLWGFFKKVVVADRLAVFVNEVYSSPSNFSGRPVTLAAATCFFALQIYYDFSAYSDIARGAAKVMGFNLMVNFDSPYIAKSIPEFWRRWHISLSTWFKDYLYIPMGGNRTARWRVYFNLFVTFLVSGIWHGANWTFVIWGALNGLYMILSNMTRNIRKKITGAVGLDRVPAIHRLLQFFITFSLTCFAWIFFRAATLSDAVYIISHILAGFTRLNDVGPFISDLKELLFSHSVSFILIGFMLAAHLVRRFAGSGRLPLRPPIWLRWAAYYAFILCILLLGMFNNQQFIYFQF